MKVKWMGTCEEQEYLRSWEARGLWHVHKQGDVRNSVSCVARNLDIRAKATIKGNVRNGTLIHTGLISSSHAPLWENKCLFDVQFMFYSLVHFCVFPWWEGWLVGDNDAETYPDLQSGQVLDADDHHYHHHSKGCPHINQMYWSQPTLKIFPLFLSAPEGWKTCSLLHASWLDCG